MGVFLLDVVLVIGAVFIKKYSNYRTNQKKVPRGFFPKPELTGWSTGTEEKKENSPRRGQTFSPPCRFSLNAINIEINPLDINHVTFLHVASGSSVAVARGQH